jgi:hypothetical protein
MWGFDTFEEILETALENGYKSIWILYRCKEEGIHLTIKDLYRISKTYGHKPNWVKYKAEEFGIPNNAQQNEPNTKKPKEKKTAYPFSFFEGIKNKSDLKKTYRKWAKELHPDISGGNDKEFMRMKKEYEQKKMYC